MFSAISNAVTALALAILAATAAANYRAGLASRVPADRFVRTFNVSLRRPEVAQTVALAATSDIAADVLAAATLDDAVMPVDLSGATPEVRSAWIDSVAKMDDQLAAAAALSLDAIASRPGWPYHQSLLGQLVWQRGSRRLDPDLSLRYERWQLPLLKAARHAPADEGLSQSLALGYLQTWPQLAAVHEKTAAAVFRKAFADEEFVRAIFASAMDVLGRQRAVSYLPDAPRPLWMAFEQISLQSAIRNPQSATSSTASPQSAISNQQSAMSIHLRWDKAEWSQRGIDLADIERHAARGDTDDVRGLCEEWARRHSVWDYDSPAARAQAARLLEFWPAGRHGKWNGDPRAEIVRYFLAGRTPEVEGTVLAQVAASLTGVPLPIQAQVRILAGDVYGADSIARSADGFGSFEWTPYLLELSRYWLRSNNAANAAAALAQLAPGAREECDAAILRRVVQGGPEKDHRGPVSEEEAGLKEPIEIGRDYTLCLSSGSGRSLIVNVSAVTPLVLDYGWDGARSATVVIDASHQAFAIALPKAEGRRRLTTRVVSGGSAGTMTATWRY